MDNRKKLLLLSTLVIASSLPGMAFAKGRPVDKSALENFYLKSGDLSDMMGSSTLQSGDKVSIGYRPLAEDGALSKTRFEQELSYSEPINGINNSTNTKFMSNLIYDIGNSKSFKPYLGVGAGLMYNETENSANFTSNIESTETYRTYHVMAGFTYEPEEYPSVTMRAGYVYAATSGNPSLRGNLNTQQEDPNGQTVAGYVSFKF
jgi:opacity protein-like surface antigen